MVVDRGGRGGRPSKGKRDQFVSRVPWELGDLVRERADAEQVTVSDYIAVVLAERVGRPDLAPGDHRMFNQQELPITDVA